MATSIDEAILEAIAEIKSKSWVIDAELDPTFSEEKPCNYLRKRLNVFHIVNQGGTTYSGKDFYINKSDFTYRWAMGGPTTEISTPFRDLVNSKIPLLISNLGVDWAEITQCDETNKSATVYAVKGTTENLAETWVMKVWKTGETTVGYKIISKTTVS